MTQRILSVDDNPINLKVVSDTLVHAGYEGITANTVPEALSPVNEIRPDLIILDVMIPDMNGYDVCRRPRERPETAHAPIVMLTAHDILEEKIKGYEAGANKYLSKPFQPAELATPRKTEQSELITAEKVNPVLESLCTHNYSAM